MEFQEALKKRLPLQIRLPNPRRPLESGVRHVAEAFLVDTTQGPAVVWLDPFWCGGLPEQVCHIAYASPRGDAKSERWIDNDPRYGPRCLAYQKPFLMERLDPESPAWSEYEAWRGWLDGKPDLCGREAAWAQVKAAFGELIVARRA